MTQQDLPHLHRHYPHLMGQGAAPTTSPRPATPIHIGVVALDTVKAPGGTYVSARTLRATIMGVSLLGVALGGITTMQASPWVGLPIVIVALVCLVTATRRDPHVARSYWWGQWWPTVALILTFGLPAFGLLALLMPAIIFIAKAIGSVIVLALLCSTWFFIKRF